VVQPPTTSGTTVSGPHHPTVLPNTGAPRSLALLATGGLVLALAGAGLLALRRRA